MPPADCRDSVRKMSAIADPVEAFASESFREISHKYAEAYLNVIFVIIIRNKLYYMEQGGIHATIMGRAFCKRNRCVSRRV